MTRKAPRSPRHAALAGCRAAHRIALDLDAVAGIEALRAGYGHVELVYDFAEGGEADGWLHAIFRYRHRASGHGAETSFGVHVFNTILTYRDEPQSYVGAAAGIVDVRLSPAGSATTARTIRMCHLIYPASQPVADRKSATEIILYDAGGSQIAPRILVHLVFGIAAVALPRDVLTPRIARKGAGPGPGGMWSICDTTCRLFGYHGLIGRDGAFSLDHMFGY